MKPPKEIANFDSATGMARATAHYLSGKDFPALGLSPALKPFAARANLLPKPLRRALYIFSGWNESLPPEKMQGIDLSLIPEWVAQQYPRRQYPAVAIGSSCGAAVHLYAALGIPWLPQTFLVPVRQSVHPDEPVDAMEMGLEPGSQLLEANPDVQLHHMHDANQDRLMVRTMTYFRIKRRTLGEHYERFLEETLPPGGTIFVMDCRRTWPTARISDRHVFQHGALGGASETEFMQGSDRVEEYLEREGSHHRRWPNPEPDGRSPEAEWGFETALMEDIERIARERHYRVRRVVFEEPESMSPFVAELYRWWYRRRRIPSNRLLIESFIVLEPWWALRTGSVPFWMKFNMKPSLQAVHNYLDTTQAYDDIRLMLFQHGVEAVGLPTKQDWEKLLARAVRSGETVGADLDQFPIDYAQYARYHTEIQKIPARYPLPAPLTLDQLDEFISEHGRRFADVEWEDVAAAVG